MSAIEPCWVSRSFSWFAPEGGRLSRAVRSGRWRKVGAMTRRPILGPDGLMRVWGIEFFENDDGRKPVLDWIKNDLSPTKRRALGSAMRRVLQIHGISEDEARDRFGLNPSEDVLLRVFCTTRAGAVVLLLHAYDKGEDPSKRRQQAEIGEARRRLKILERRDAAARKTQRRSGRRQP